MDSYIFYGLAIILFILSFIKDKKNGIKKEIQVLYDQAATFD